MKVISAESVTSIEYYQIIFFQFVIFSAFQNYRKILRTDVILMSDNISDMG